MGEMAELDIENAYTYEEHISIEEDEPGECFICGQESDFCGCMD